MSGILKINNDNGLPVNCHLMPFKINYKGPGATANYFETTIIQPNNQIKSSSSTLEASFRGRPFKGKELNIPSGYFGAIIKKNNQIEAETIGEFNKLYYWKYDEEVSETDPLPSSLNWFLVSSAIHESTSESENNK